MTNTITYTTVCFRALLLLCLSGVTGFNYECVLCVNISMCLCPTSEGEMLLLLSVQVGGGGDQTGVRVDAEELKARARQQTVPHHGILLCRRDTGG